MSDMPVHRMILEKLPATLLLAITATLISVLISVFLGTIAAFRKGSLVDMFSLLLALVWVSIPSFWLGILFIILFALNLQLLPSIGYVDIFKDFSAGIRHLILPAFTLGAVFSGAVTRMVRAEMIEQLSQDYVTTAWAKGLPLWKIVYKHSLKNAFIPIITFIWLATRYLVGRNCSY